MSQINVRNLSNENDDGSPEIVGVSTFSATSFFVPPKGTTAERPSDCEPGSIRFNTDTSNLEYYRGKVLGWSQFDLVTPNLGGGTGSNTGVGVRGLMMGGNGSPDNTREEIEFITISTLGNSQDFGELTQGSQSGIGNMSSRTNAFYAGGSLIPAGVNVINRITMASLGNGVDYGDTLTNRAGAGGVSNQIRAIIMGGNADSPVTNVIEYFSMTQSGNAVDFGDLATAREQPAGGVNSSTRGLLAGGSSPSTNQIDFITMSTLGDSQDFADLTDNISSAAGGCNSTRGLFAGGALAPGRTNIISFVTIATKSDATDFGDLTVKRQGVAGMSSPTRAVFSGGALTPNPIYNVLDYVTISTLGNALDFGDIAGSGSDNGQIHNHATASNGHGGL